MTAQQDDGGGPGARTICVDFDGVVHAYSKGWHDGTCYDDPLYGAAVGLAALLDQGWRVIIHTARDPAAAIAWMDQRLDRGLCDRLFIWTGRGKPIAHVYLDDRGLRFESWDQALRDLKELFP